MRRFAHTAKIIALWVAAVSLALAVLAFAVSFAFYHILTLPSVQERALRIAEGKVAAMGLFNGDVTIERLESNLISYVDIYGVRAVGKSGYGDSVYVGRVTARYWLPPLLRRTVTVRKATVTDVRGHVVMSPEGDIMIPFIPVYYYEERDTAGLAASGGAAPAARPYWRPKGYKGRHGGNKDGPPDPSSWPVKVKIGRVRVNGINAVYRDFRNNMVGEIANATAAARFYDIDSFWVELRVPDGSYTSPWWSGGIDTIGASGVVTWRDLDVHSLLLKGSGTHVTASGKLSYYEGKPWNLRADFITSIKPLPVIYENAEGLGRDCFFEGSATFGGTLYEPVFGARVKGHGITYRGYGLASLDVDAAYGLDGYGRARVGGAGEFGRFDVDASLLMKNLMRGPEFGDYSADVFLSKLDAKRIAEELKIKLPVPIDGGQARVKAGGKSFEIPARASLSAEFEGANLAGGRTRVKARRLNDRVHLAGRRRGVR
jgi:hypothetical protein